MGHDPHTKIPLRSQDCSWVSKSGHCEDNGHRINSRFTFHKGDSSSVSRSIRTQRKTSDTGYNVHIIQSYVGILDSPDIRGNISKPFTRQRMNFSVMRNIMSWDTILTPRSHSGVKIVLEYPNQDCKDNGHRIN